METLKLFSISNVGVIVPVKVVQWHSAPPDYLLPLAEVASIRTAAQALVTPDSPIMKRARFVRIKKMESGEWMYILTDES